MILIRPRFEILNISADLTMIEQAGRTCYKSEAKITGVSATEFVRSILKRGHESVIEHSSVTVRIVCDRGVTHEIVRHRLASYSQESTRYCNYKGGVTFVIPPWVNITAGEYNDDMAAGTMDSYMDRFWFDSMHHAESMYIGLINGGWTPQQARSVLPNSLKTEIIMTANLREWRHFFNLRTSPAAHPQMREIAIPMLSRFKRCVPVVFADIHVKKA